ncbi:MAG: hypothetical protein EOP48_04365 [Sphingobacteriales bacterium]|nr:MAG: hypothetical protein EOP48_04365 [Sphingobacteriales bacterium]
MTPKQIEQFRSKIANIKRTLAAEKRKFGCYDDSRELRYLPVKYFVQLQDYKGGLAYLQWFSKNFPDDGGFPDFLFEWTIILFKCGKAKDAARMAFETFCANTYLFDRFFDRPITPLDKWEGSNLETPEFTANLEYSSTQAELADFSAWLNTLIATDDFKTSCEKYIDIHKRLKTENDRETRSYLITQVTHLKDALG